MKNTERRGKLNEEFINKAEELVGKMTIEEAMTQLRFNAPAIDRLGIPSYNWWNEGLHGLARSGTATVFPQAVGLASMFDRDILQKIADVVSTEARARYNECTKDGDRGIYKGITLWSPNINIFRDPRWGRGQETFGEDPYLTGELGLSFIKGLQGDGKYLKTAACAKHFAVHSGPEAVRHSFNAEASPKDMNETYLPAFEKAVKAGNVETVMGAYNRTNGEPCCGSETLLDKTLRKEWGFKGHVVSDCWAIRDFHTNHKVTDAPFESVAMALNAGCDLNCGNSYECMQTALDEGLITEETIRTAAKRLFTTRMKLGMFADDCEYDSLGQLDIDTPESRKLSYEASCKSIVMLKNDGILPLKNVKTIGVIGPTAASIEVLNGNYNGTAAEYITNLTGIQRVAGDDIRVLYAKGSHLYLDKEQPLGEVDDRIAEALSVARHSDVIVVSVGLDATLEGEEGDTGNAFAAGDKVNLFLPDCQRRLIRKLAEIGTPMILVNNTGSAMDLTEEEGYASAILQCWYSGAYGGLALADTIFGKNNPSGKLPVTFYKDGTLPDFEDYSMKGRTYRYLYEDAEYPFGYGLSYTKFSYDSLDIRNSEDSDKIICSFNVTNIGDISGEEVSEIYIAGHIVEKAENEMNDAYLGKMEIDNQPKWSLAGFERISLNAGEKKRITVELDKDSFKTVLSDGSKELLHGKYTIYVGGSQPDELSRNLTGSSPISIEIDL